MVRASIRLIPQVNCTQASRGAGQRAVENCRQAWDGLFYTQAEFHEYYGFYVGEANWQNAQDEATESDESTHDHVIGASRRRSDGPPVTQLMVKRRRHSTVYPAPTLYQAAQLAWDEVHNAAHAKHTEYMMFLKSILTDFGDIWRSLNEPKKLLASWTSQLKSLTCTLEAIARDAAAHNCRSASDCRVTSVAQPASIEKLSDTSSSLVRKINRTCEKEAQFFLLLDQLALVTVQKTTWEEVKRFFESTRGQNAAFNTYCAKEADRELNQGKLQMKEVADEAQQLLNAPSWRDG